jgi:hypothetical protein
MELLVAGHCWGDLETAAVRHRQTAAQYLNLHATDLSAEVSSAPRNDVTFLGSHREEVGWATEAVWTFRSREYLVPYPESNRGSSFCQLVVQSVPILRYPHSFLLSHRQKPNTVMYYGFDIMVFFFGCPSRTI